MAGVYVPPMRDTSVLSTVMKGLSIARDVYGLKTDMSNLERAEANAQAEKRERERLAKGKLNQGEILKLKLGGHKEVAEGTPGGVSINTADNRRTTIIPPDKKTPLQQVVTKGDDGKPVTVFIRPREGASYAKPDDQTGPDPYKRGQDVLGHTTELRNKYDNDATTKRTLGVIDAYKAVTGAASAENPTGATDIRLVYSFMKAMDPNSTVREGEYATAENSGGAWTKAGNVYNRLLSGERLAPEQRTAFAGEAEAMMSDQLASQAETDARYEALAKRYNVGSGDVVDPRFKGFKPRGSGSVTASPKAAGKPAAGDTVEVAGKRYRVAADGNTLEPVAGTAGP